MPIMIIYTFSSQDFLDFGNESNQLTQQSHILFYIVLFALCYFTGSKKPEQSLKKHNKLFKHIWFTLEFMWWQHNQHWCKNPFSATMLHDFMLVNCWYLTSFKEVISLSPDCIHTNIQVRFLVPEMLKMYTSTILVKVLQFTDVARPLQHVFMSTEPCRQMKAPEVVI